MSTFSYEYKDGTSGVTTRIAGCGKGIIRVTHTKRDSFLPPESPVVTGKEQNELFIEESEDSVRVKSENITVVIRKPNGSLAFESTDGKALLCEPRRRPHILSDKPVVLNRMDSSKEAKVRMSVDGMRADGESAGSYVDRTAYECRQNFVFDADEALYGLGSHEEGYGNLRGKTRQLYQQNTKAVVPVLVSTKGWGILFDMGCHMVFHDDAEGSYLWADCTDELNWYFFYGDGSYASIMECYRRLTGATPLLPLYSLGFIQSKERYKDADELLAVADEYRRRQVPLDMVVQDWQTWPEGQWGWKTFDRTRYPDPDELTRQLHERNVKMMISVWPTMGGDLNENRKEMLEHGCMLGNNAIYNAFLPEARKLYWKQANEGLFSHGIDAWWCDCTEPFECDWFGNIKPEPCVRATINTAEAKKYVDPTRISLFSLYHSEGIYSGQRGVTDKKRVLNLTRSSYAGQHRYATITWSGDISAKWETLRRQVPEGLNFCATGEGYWSLDIGAFFPGSYDPWFIDGDYDDGVDDLGYRELFVRWTQLGACLPCMRAHGQRTPREIWRFGEKGTMFYDALEKTINLRYHLVPYMYGLMEELSRKGIPMLRVPALAFPEDKALRANDTELMIGDAILARPVTHPMLYGPGSEKIENPQTTVDVQLPAGCVWYPLGCDEPLQGGTTIRTEVPLDVLPLYVKAGTILPWGASVQHTGELSQKPLSLIVYPGKDAEYSLYEDEGDGYGYEKGEFSRIPMSWNEKDGTLTVGEREGSYPGMREERVFLVSRVGQKPQEILYTGREVTVKLPR